MFNVLTDNSWPVGTVHRTTF